jgi:hypothetical protein
MKRAYLELMGVFVLTVMLSGGALGAETVIHYDNLNDPGFYDAVTYPDDPYRHVKLGPDTPGGGVAQMFTAGESSAVTSVTMGLAAVRQL